MDKADKAALAVVVGVVGAAAVATAVNYLTCRLRNGWYLEPGQPDSCIPPAIRAGLKAGVFTLFRIPLPLQFGIEGIEYVSRDRHLYHPYTEQVYYLGLPEESFDADFGWGGVSN